jgi:hypothetical protein
MAAITFYALYVSIGHLIVIYYMHKKIVTTRIKDLKIHPKKIGKISRKWVYLQQELQIIQTQ